LPVVAGWVVPYGDLVGTGISIESRSGRIVS
jgi:hypothetical protein